ncbi:MAG: hypothetical protein CMA12_00995 [Euryarchaeota archaeon]|nr:hypothetical protein [Euryarchaeota archaeon]
MKHYDVIVIGSGINSLSSAALLAKAGKSVLVLEARKSIGGMASTIDFSPEHKCNIITDSIKWINPKLLQELHIRSEDLQIFKPEITHIALGEDNEHIYFHQDPRKTANSIKNLSVKDAEHWEDFTSYIKKLTEFLERLYQNTPPKLPDIGVSETFSMKNLLNPILRHGTRGIVDLLRVAPMMMPEMMDEWFENNLLRGALSSIGIHHSSLGPFAASTGYNFLHQHLYSNGVIHSNTFIKGGTVKFAEVLQNISKSHNVEFRVNAKVKSIKLDNEFCKGVVLENGDEIESNIVVSGVDPKNTFINLVGSPNLNPNFRTQVRNIKYRGSIARMHFLLRDLPNIHNIRKEDMATMFSICPSIEYLERASDSMKYGCLPDNPFISFCFPTLLNPDFSSGGNHILSSTIQYVPYRLRKQKWGSETNEILKQITIKTLEKFIPGFNKLIESCTIYSPKDLENEFGLSEGNLNHGEMTLDQFMFMRPTISTAQYKAPFKNLYLCGPGTHPGGGLHGTNALNSVKEILKN